MLDDLASRCSLSLVTSLSTPRKKVDAATKLENYSFTSESFQQNIFFDEFLTRFRFYCYERCLNENK